MKKVYFAFLFVFIFQLTQAQNISNYAGNGSWGFSGDGGAAVSAQLYTPVGLATDGAGNVYIADFNNNRVRKVNAATGVITTVAGNGTSGYTGDGMAATSSALHDPYGVAVDKFGNLFIADAYNNRIRKVTASTGLISTVAGSSLGGFAGDGGPATSARLNQPNRVAVDTAGNIYICDTYNNRIRKVTASTGNISTIAGTGTSGFNGDTIAATTAQLNHPFGVAVDLTGNVYIADQTNHRIRKIDQASGLIYTIAGNGNGGYTGDGMHADSALINYPFSVSVDAASNVFIADENNHRIRKITAATGIISTVAGTGTSGNSGDGGPADSAKISQPYDAVVDPCGNIFVADLGNDRVRKVSQITPTMHWADAGCPGNNGGVAFVTLTGGVAPYTYTWSTGSHFFGATNLYAGTYSVVITDSRGCEATASVTISNTPAPAPINICMVTVDDSSKNNVIYWDKTGHNFIQSFNIYRDTANNDYAKIGNVLYDSLSMFIDTARHIGAVNGDPNITTYRYKISAVDSCGIESPLSPYHNTVYTYNTGSQFLFNAYQIEGQSIPVPGLTGYVLRRDNFNTGTWVVAGSGAASSTLINDPNYNTYQSTANWVVETQWTTQCTPTFFRQSDGTQSTIVKSKSNITNNRVFGINSSSLDNKVEIYPNPASAELNIQISETSQVTMQLFDVRGKMVMGKTLHGGVNLISTSDLSEGVYTMRLFSKEGVSTKKLVVAR